MRKIFAMFIAVVLGIACIGCHDHHHHHKHNKQQQQPSIYRPGPMRPGPMRPGPMRPGPGPVTRPGQPPRPGGAAGY